MKEQSNANLASSEIKRLKQIELELKTRLEQQAAVVQIGQRALASTDVDALFDEAVRLLVDTLGVEFCKVLELLPDGQALLLRAGVGWKEGLVGRTTVSIGKGSQAGYTLRVREPVIVTDLREEQRFSGPPLLVDHGVVSGMSVIIPGSDQPFGVLGVHTTQSRKFTFEDARFLQSVANLLASAIVRIKAEAAMRTSRDQLAVILESVADGITVQAPDGSLLYANNAAAHLSGYPSAEAFLRAPLSEVIAKFELLDEAGNSFPLERLPGRLALTGVEGAQELIRFRVQATGEEHWSLVKATPVRDPSGQVIMAINIFQDVTELKRQEGYQSILAEAGKLLTNPLDYEKTLMSVAQMAVPRMADWCAVHISEEQGSIRSLAVAHADPKQVELARELQERYPPEWDSPTGVAKVLRTGQPEFVPEISEEILEAGARDAEHYRVMRELGLKSALIMPLVARERVLGTLSFVWSDSKRRYTGADIALAEELARRAALAIDNARLFRDSQKLNAELEARVTKRTAQLQSIITKLRNEIAERKKAEDALRKSESLLQSLFDSAPDATILVNKDGIIEDVNSQVETMFGYPRRQLINKSVDILLPKRLQKRHEGLRKSFLAEPRLRPMGADLELFGRRKDGSEFPIDIMLSPVEIEKETLVIGAIRDISERKQMEAELAEVQRRLLDSGENERMHLAQELHDGPIQDLYAVSYALKSLNGLVEDVSNLQSASETLQQVIAQLRSICGELRPPALAPFGLERAILAHLEQLQEAHPNLIIEQDLMPDGQTLPERIRITLFRIYQHSISNVLRHAQAKRLRVHFKYDETQVLLEVQDDGCGFELPARWVELARQGHLGLVGTVERAEAIGGRVDVISTPGHGTLVRVTAPLVPQLGKEYSRGLFRFRTV